MSEAQDNPWIHIGDCPVCVNGLCRVRRCDDETGAHLFALCDECEALWTQPDTAAGKQFASPTHPQCPICGADLYGSQSRWARPEDLWGTPWAAQAIFTVTSSEIAQDESLDVDREFQHPTGSECEDLPDGGAEESDAS